MKNLFQKWRYKNTTLLLLSFVVISFLVNTKIAHLIIAKISGYGYFGAAITGIFFVSTFTIAPATIVLYTLSNTFNPYLIAVCAGVGAMIGDFLLFKFLTNKVFEELKPLFAKLGAPFLFLFKTPYFSWFPLVLGAIIIASPFPDEIGIGLMGLSKIKQWQFMALTFVLNTIGIFILILCARSIYP